MLAYHQKCFESPDSDLNFEDLDTYNRLNIYKHLGRTVDLKKIFGNLDNLLSVKNIYK